MLEIIMRLLLHTQIEHSYIQIIGEIMKLTEEMIEGIFISENKRRFLCKVLVDGKIEECYISCSSKLKHYLNLINKKVLLTVNKSKTAKTKYSVFAVKYYGKYILLNSNIVNKVLQEEIQNILDSKAHSSKIVVEKYVEAYKADLVIFGDQTTIVEAKSIIGSKRKVTFPNVNMERAIRQLKKLSELLSKGYSVEYYFVSLSPIVRMVLIDEYYKEYKSLLIGCIKKGLIVRGITLYYAGGEIKAKVNLNIKF